MEKMLGVALLIRDRRGVSLSPAGQCLLEHARLIVQQAERMRGDLACYARGLSGGDALSRSRRLRLIDIVDRKFVALPRDSALQRHLAGQERDVSVS
jgi:DNA-binding transcriptional LysR family regulator